MKSEVDNSWLSGGRCGDMCMHATICAEPSLPSASYVDAYLGDTRVYLATFDRSQVRPRAGRTVQGRLVGFELSVQLLMITAYEVNWWLKSPTGPSNRTPVAQQVNTK
jgi:hypothetical protein